ncbi:hypothetical protein [Halosolutus gelatinilyticus]|uniref:hypothetical protein n=1 Tax=Halosolutus gelatinilyticus TaxID=2931975 RepID=UPI001FF20482|nr:hypothetical protein [Halosolutus gelatinilyticus]
MRLTPSWFSSSSDVSEGERPEDADTTSGITIYYPSRNGLSTADTEDGGDAEQYVPDSNAALLVDLDEMSTPATVDEITDQLIEPAHPPIDTWADVHERLYRDRLPALEAAGEIEFDQTQGLVERARPRSGGRRSGISPTVLGVLAAGFLILLLAIVSASVLTALTVTLVTTVAVWFVPCT